jgi:hypothetical protein
MKPWRVAKKDPAMPANMAPSAKAVSFVMVTLIPRARQATSSSRSASQARPSGWRRRRMLTQLVSSKADLQKSLDQVDQVIVNRPPVEKIKKVLVVAAAACKKADLLHTTLENLQKQTTEKE